MRVNFELTGQTPLLMHADDIDAADALRAWQQDPKNKDISVRGDDRSPAWTWRTRLYYDGEHISMPQENVATCLRDAGTQLKIRGNKSFKEATQNGVILSTEHLTFLVGGKQVPIDPLVKMQGQSYERQAELVQKYGFRLFIKRARISDRAKHVRVRPRFDEWAVRGELEVVRDEITLEVLGQIFEIAGRGGLCDWRPSSKRSPGPYGMFTAKVKRG